MALIIALTTNSTTTTTNNNNNDDNNPDIIIIVVISFLFLALIGTCFCGGVAESCGDRRFSPRLAETAIFPPVG